MSCVREMERNLGGLSENQLFDAAARGDVSSLQELLKKDPLLLNRVSYTCSNKTPLHVATIHGHLPLVREILALNPDLAQELDSHKSSPLHVASSKGHLEITRALLSTAPDMCLSRDFQGRYPLHLAAMKGRVGVLEELVRLAPASAFEKLDRGATVLHLCVKYGQLEALKVLLNDEIVNEKDDDGDTVLHVAVRERRIEMIRYLADNTNIDVNAKNSKGQTSLSILDQTSVPSNPTTQEITQILTPKLSTAASTAQRPMKWLTKKRDSIMVVAILIATMAFQAGVSPPGGVWQENSSSYKAGEAIMAHNHPKAYKSFMRSNAVAFVSSLSTILLLISGLPFRRRLFMWILMVIMWLTVTSTAVTYAICIVVVTPKKDRSSLRHVIMISLAVWSGVMGILLVGNTVRLMDRWLKNRGVFVWRPKRFRNFVHQNRGESV